MYCRHSGQIARYGQRAAALNYRRFGITHLKSSSRVASVASTERSLLGALVLFYSNSDRAQCKNRANFGFGT